MANPCEHCLGQITCTLKLPISISGKTPVAYINCLRFTCGDGEIAARKAIKKGKLETFMTSDGVHNGFRFGTHDKPTDTSRYFSRYVDPNGMIYFQKKGELAVYTGRQILPF